MQVVEFYIAALVAHQQVDLTYTDCDIYLFLSFCDRSFLSHFFLHFCSSPTTVNYGIIKWGFQHHKSSDTFPSIVNW